MKATVVSLDRFAGRMWKGLQCDCCGLNYTGVISSASESQILSSARSEGWDVATGNIHVCPNCQGQESA